MARRTQLPKTAGSKLATRRAARKPLNAPLLLGVVIGAVILLIAGVVLLQSRSLRQSSDTQVRVGEGLSWGPESAKVKVVEYSDFGCTYCRQFALSQGRQLRAEYEAGGQVKFEFKHFIIEGPTTAGAANAAECAADLGRFWDYHDVLFGQQGVTQQPFAKSALKAYAAQLGLETAPFNRCVDGDQHLEKVYRDTSEGKGQGVQATPTFFVNGQKLEGALPYTQFKAVIDAAVAASK